MALFARAHGRPIPRPMIESTDQYGRPVKIEDLSALPPVQTSVTVGGRTFVTGEWRRASADFEAVPASGPLGQVDAPTQARLLHRSETPGRPWEEPPPRPMRRVSAEAMAQQEAQVRANPHLEVGEFDSDAPSLPLDSVQWFPRYEAILRDYEFDLHEAERVSPSAPGLRRAAQRAYERMAYLMREIKRIPPNQRPGDLLETLADKMAELAQVGVNLRASLPVGM